MKLTLKIAITLGIVMLSVDAVQISSMTFMQSKSKESAQLYLKQQSHNCNSNIDRLKKGPVDWMKVEGSGKLFTDHSFPADETMLSWKEYPRTVGGLAKYLSWFKEFKRPKDLHTIAKDTKNPHPTVSLFGKDFESKGKLSSHDLEQGSVGDNYLITVVAALAERGKFIPAMFNQTKYNNEGIFTIRAYVKGRPEDITVDDLFPVYSHQPAFVKPSVDGGWWLPLIEKAFAKVHVNYEMISSGTHAEAARFLTGSPAQEFVTNVQSVDEIWSSINNAVRNDYMITAACFIEWKGLVAGHGYIVKDFFLINNADGTQVRLVKVRNPWKQIGDTSFKQSSHGDWTGDFSKDDTKSWTEVLKKKGKFEQLKQGEFFMTIEDFKQGFKYYTITYLHVGWKTSFIEKRSSVNRRLYKFNFTVSEEDYNSNPYIPKTVMTQEDQDENLGDEQNVQVSSKENTILGSLSKHLLESQNDLDSLKEDSTISDAIDYIQLDSDLEIEQESRALNREQSEIDLETEQEQLDEQILQKEKMLQQSSEEMETTEEESQDNPTPQPPAAVKVETPKAPVKSDAATKTTDLSEEDDPVAAHEIKADNDQSQAIDRRHNQGSFQAYIGAELYDKRMFPHGCPSYQKAFVKLFKVEKGQKGGAKLKLIDAQFFNNRDGFGFMLRNLTKGDYQIQFKKYSNGFDVFDFTTRIYADKMIKLIDDDGEEMQRVKLKEETENNMPTIKEKRVNKKKIEKKRDPEPTVESKDGVQPLNDHDDPKQQHQEATQQNDMKKPLIAVTQMSKPSDGEDQVEITTETNHTVYQNATSLASQGQETKLISKAVLANKLQKAISLANDPKNDKFFETHQRDFYYMKDAMDKKHGFYYLRVGTDSDQYDLSLKVKMFLKGDHLETTEKNEKLYVYKYPEDKFPGGDYKLTTYCNIRPDQGKKTCDFLVPTAHHDRTYIYVQKKLKIGDQKPSDSSA